MAVYEVKSAGSSKRKAKAISEALRKAGFKKPDEDPDLESNMMQVKSLAPDLGGDNQLDDRFRESIRLANDLMSKMTTVH